MTTDDLKQLLENKSWRTEIELGDTGLRLFLQNTETGECGVLAVEPTMLTLPDEAALDYSWQDVVFELGPPPEECLILNLKTNIDPDFKPGDTPFLFS